MNRRVSSPALSQTLSLRRLSIFAFGLLAVSAIVFRDFLFGDKVLLYKDIGSDSLNDYFPSFVHLSDYIRTSGYPSWSFSVGMGQSIFYLIGYLILDPVCWLPKDLIAQALVWQHLLKILVAGLLFARFLQLRGLGLRASFTGALLFSLSAYMCMGSCWIVLADEAVCFAFALFAVEAAISNQRWIYLVFAIVLISLVSVFHVYLCALLLCFYVPARLVEIGRWKPSASVRYCLTLAAVAGFGLALGAVTLLPSIYAVFHSARGSWVVNANWPTPSFYQTESPLYYWTAILRWLSNDSLGTGNAYHGWHNYFEAPATYGGLLPILLLPQVFLHPQRRRRLLYALFLILIIIPVLLPWFRYLFWLFQGGYFRSFSLFSFVGIIALTMPVFSTYTRGSPLNLWVLALTFIALLAILYCPSQTLRKVLDPDARSTIAIFISVYTSLLALGQITRRQDLLSRIVVVAVVVEITIFAHKTVSDRPTVTKSELGERVGYNDETVNAIRDIKARDSGFFRITKTWSSSPAQHGSLNDAMIFGYAGTSSYSSFNSRNYVNFLLGAGAIPPRDVSQAALWTEGLLGKPLLSTFACEKYVLNKPPVTLADFPNYQPIAHYGEIEVLRNEWSVPFGIFLTNSISPRQFGELWPLGKAQALLRAVVIPEAELAIEKNTIPLNDDALRAGIPGTSTPDLVSQLRLTSLTPRFFRQTRIEGTLAALQNGILVFQMPFDAGWHVRIDGQSMPTRVVDFGLLGVPIVSGNHEVILRYRPPWLISGALTTLLSVIILLVCLRRWPRLRGPAAVAPNDYE